MLATGLGFHSDCNDTNILKAFDLYFLFYRILKLRFCWLEWETSTYIRRQTTLLSIQGAICYFAKIVEDHIFREQGVLLQAL